MYQNKKHDTRIRFQNRSFVRQLEQARNYKRQVKKIPETKIQIILARIGLGSILARILVIVILLFLLYLVYIPNFLTVKNVKITGFNQGNERQLKDYISQYTGRKTLWPQSNILLLSKTRLSRELTEKDTKILKIKDIRKKLFNTIEIDIEPRQDNYVVETPSNRLIVGNDGLITKVLPLDATSTETSGLVKIIDKENKDRQAGQTYLTDEFYKAIGVLQDKLPVATGSNIEFYEQVSPDIRAKLAAGYKVYFDSKLIDDIITDRLKLLLTEISDQDKKRLFYIDMRINGRGYVCYKNTPCATERPSAQETPISASSTPVSNP